MFQTTLTRSSFHLSQNWKMNTKGSSTLVFVSTSLVNETEGRYLTTHPRRFSTQISSEMMARLKEINGKYVAEDICTAVLSTVLRAPKPGEQAQAVLVGEIIGWLTTRTGANPREYTPQKVNAAIGLGLSTPPCPPLILEGELVTSASETAVGGATTTLPALVSDSPSKIRGGRGR